MKEELQNILVELQSESNPFSFELECPHIMRALKLFCGITFGRLHLVAHLTRGLTQQNILHYYCELGHFVHLTIAVKDVDYDYTCFRKIHECIEDMQECQHDLLGLLGFDKK
jgi:hypothetical protein